MTENTNNLTEPHKLADADLVEVSGGTIPQEIMDLTKLLPDAYVRAITYSAGGDERNFLQRLSELLYAAKHFRESWIVKEYMETGKIRTP